MSPEVWQTLGTIGALLIVGAFNGLHARRAERSAKAAHDQAATAAEQTKATSNGFADKVLDDLSELRQLTRRTHDLMVNHLNDHARRDLK